MKAGKIKERKTTRKAEDADDDDGMLPEYDFSRMKAVHNPFVEQVKAGSVTAVLLEADVAKVFKTSSEVNEALRVLIRAASTAAKIKRSVKSVRGAHPKNRNSKRPEA
jgi:hypothetical protein